MEQAILAWLAHYGAPALFGLLVLGIVGLPVPDETLLVTAGVLAGRGQLRLPTVVVAALLGTMVGISISYSIGRYAGLPLLLRFGSVVHVDRSILERVHRWFGRFGKWLLPVAYFIPGVRHLAAAVAGTSGLSVPVFAAFAYTGAVAWVSCFLSIGYVLGDRWRVVVEGLHRHVALIVLVAAVAAVVYLLVVRARRFKTRGQP
jgi:membrane protein DedA with SNARE-associated domain